MFSFAPDLLTSAGK